MKESLDEHSAIVDAIRRGDADRARTMAEEHLYITTVLMKQLFADLGIGEKRWEASPFSVLAHSGSYFPQHVRICDCTRRDGEQQVDIVFTKEDKLEIARTLDDLGVNEIEAGTPAASDEDRLAIEMMAGSGLTAKISALAQGHCDDIDLVAKSGAWGRRSMPISAIQRINKLNLGDEDSRWRAPGPVSGSPEGLWL
jgi:hydroxymethylglutaryl-coenzyme A lyase family protein/FCD domain-containing protein